ncbi:hypothetical protein [Bradyrhizobium sp. SZCCHNS1054]|uniref:hypothetical protein n=1 Tax=Bradyrhizobium sp. SZCCHNS1054 TaxID=3057301 RepID=UPI002916A775|nr:hypothetical protein [Bradyrhizobium sp. SZCCHNS1054]
MRREGVFIEFVSFTNDDAGNPIYENTVQYAILRREWMSGDTAIGGDTAQAAVGDNIAP